MLAGCLRFVSFYLPHFLRRSQVKSRVLQQARHFVCQTQSLSAATYPPSALARTMAMNTDLERLSDVLKLSAHVTRVLGQNPGLMTLQGTNSYLLQPPSNPLAPLILIDTSSPHTAKQYVDLFLVHLHHLGLESGIRETHFESSYAQNKLKNIDPEKHDEVKARIIAERRDDPKKDAIELVEYGPGASWAPNSTKDRRLPAIEHIILTHRHLDHVGALPLLLTTLKENGLPPPKLWKYPSPDEAELALSEKDRPTSDASLWAALPPGSYTSFSPLQPFHPIMPGLMISIIDPNYRHLLKHDKDGKPKWVDVPEVARVSLRCLRTPGHTADSVSLVMLEGERGVFTGDTVLGQGTTVFTDLSSYLISLKTLLALKPSVLYPAHGPHITTPEKCRNHINDYITHRQEREDQILDILTNLSQFPGSLGARLAEVDAVCATKRIEDAKKLDSFYQWSDKTKKSMAEKPVVEEIEAPVHTPIDPMAFPIGKSITVPLLCRLMYKTDKEGIIAAAGKSTLAHLVKLEKEGKVSRTMITIPKIVDNVVTEPQKQEAWQLA